MMHCPYCGGKLGVYDGVCNENNEVYRRRKCKKCRKAIFTVEYEIHETAAKEIYRIKKQKYMGR